MSENKEALKMWNNLYLECPSDDFSEYPPQDQYLTEQLRDFVTVLTTTANTLTSGNPLWLELEVLRNIEVKYKRLLHCDRSLTFLQRVGHCLKKMVLLNLSKSYLNLAEKFLMGLQNSSMPVYLPSRQQVEYILIRTITASKLVCDGIKYSRETFCFLVRKLKVGHLTLDLVMAASVVARLNILLRATVEELCSMYQQVLSWRYKLKRGTFQWAGNSDLPQDLAVWLKNAETGSLDSFTLSKSDVKHVFNMLKPGAEANENKDSDSESIIIDKDIEIIQIDDADVGSTTKNDATDDESTTESDDTDYGEVVSRSQLQRKSLQKSLLQKILQTKSLRRLEILWMDMQSLPNKHFPKKLSTVEKKAINRCFSRVKEMISGKTLNEIIKEEPKFIRAIHSLLCKHLGFTQNDIETCKNSSVSKPPDTKETELGPVKTFKDLKILYKRLCQVLKFTNNTKAHQKLKKIFKQRKADINLLKNNGEKATAKKLIFCTSKLLLTLCQN